MIRAALNLVEAGKILCTNKEKGHTYLYEGLG